MDPAVAEPVAETAAPPDLVVRPLTTSNWPDLVALFERPGASIARGCWCMYYRESGKPTVAVGKRLADTRRAALRRLVVAGKVPGLIGYQAGQPVGWVSLGPREDYRKLARSPVMKPVDDTPVWSIVCFFVDARARGQGVSRVLLAAAIDWAKSRQATWVEAYPVDKPGFKDGDSLWFGTQSLYDTSGFVEVARRKPTRSIMRKRLEPAR